MVVDINQTAELTVQNIPQLFKRMAEPGEIAGLVAYLLGDESRFVTGAAYTIDGGFCA
jgi:3-oxoacyl-[acyl-carrier protein] reductase